MWEVLSKVADVTGLLAFVLVALGVLSTVVTRPRMTVTASSTGSTSTSALLRYDKGSSAVRNLNMGFGTLDGQGVARSGDTSEWRRDVMLPNDMFSVTLYDPAQMTFSGEPGINERRIGLSMPNGAMVDFSWQHPFVPWLRARQVVFWSMSDRAAARPPLVLRGRRARRAFKTAMTPPD